MINNYNDSFNNEDPLSKIFICLGLALLATSMIILSVPFTEIAFLIRIILGLCALSVAIILITSSYTIKLRKISLYLVTTIIAMLGALPVVGMKLSFIIPTAISFYTYDKKFIKNLQKYNSHLFIVSCELRAFLNAPNMGVPFTIETVFAVLLISFLEIYCFNHTIFPFLFDTIKKNQEYKIALKEKESATNEILHFCSTATSYHNKYLRWHIKGVKYITQVILDQLIEDGKYIPKDYYDQIIFSVQFHDIGKIYIDPAILDKNGKLTDDEFNLIKEHPSRGVDLFALLPRAFVNNGWDTTCKNIIAQHHERLDGTGYPLGLQNDEICFEARVVAVADVVDALLSWRPYKNPMSWENMTNILLKNDKAYDQDIVKAILKNKKEILRFSSTNNENIARELQISEDNIKRV